MSEDKTEILVIEASIMNLFRRDAKGTLIGLFSQIKTGGDVVRERAIRFLGNKMKIEQSLLNKEAEVTLLREVKASLEVRLSLAESLCSFGIYWILLVF